MKYSRKLIARILIPFIVLLNCPLSVFAAPAEESLSLKIEHSKIKKVKAGETIPVNAKFMITEGIEIVRVYFRAAGRDPYCFVPMIASKNSEYYTILPAPDGSAEKIEYLFLVKTYDNRVFTSNISDFVVTGKLDKVAATDTTDIIDVSVETKKSPAKIAGFTKNTRIRLVTQSEKHGVLAGLYDRKDTGGTASNGQYHGTVELSKSSRLNPWLIGGGAVAGLVAVVAVAGSSGGGDSGSSSGGGADSTSTDSTGNGLWTLQFEDPPCSKTTSQTVNCSAEGLVTSVSPTAIGVPQTDSCTNTPYGGVADIFIVGGSCDTVTACNNYSSPDLSGKTCADKSIILYKNDGARVERWSVQ